MIGRAVEVLGFRGIKVHGHDSLPGRAVCEAARRWRLPILVDVVRRPAASRCWPPVPRRELDRAAPRRLRRRLGGVPPGHRPDHPATRTSTPTPAGCVLRRLVEAVRRAGPGKVIFGSDGPQLHPGVELRKVELLGLPPWAQALVTGGTILRLLGPGPAVIKTPARVMP